MSPELELLTWSVALTIVLMLIALLGNVLEVGVPKLAGNREDMPAVAGWAGRAVRAHRNLLENLVLFAILVFAAREVGVSNAMTVLGAQLFFWGRVAHAVIYVLGVPWLRTLAFLASVAGLVLIFTQILPM